MVQLTVQQALHLLELQPGATTEQLRAAYKRLALRYHPDKQQQQSRRPTSNVATAQPQHRHSSSSAHDSVVSFSLLSAAYQLLTSTAASTEHQIQPHSSCSSSFPSFEAAYASGGLFTEQLVDEAVLSGASPAEIASIQHYVTAAAVGQLAEALKQQPPTAEDEHLWHQLHKHLTVKWQVQQQQQQMNLQQRRQAATAGRPATGDLLADLLSDVLLSPVGEQLVEVSDDLPSEEIDARETAAAAVATAPTAVGCSRPATEGQDTDEQQARADPTKCCNHQTQQVGSKPRSQQQQQQQQQEPADHSSSCSSGNTQKRQVRHGLGFYWTWLRRLVVAKAVVSILLSGKTRTAHDDFGLFTML